MITTLKVFNKRVMRKLILFGLMILSLSITTSVCQAQKLNLKNDTISWEYGRGENKTRSESLTISGRFISYAEKGFLWVQNGTDTKYFFEVKMINKGDWSDTSENGEVEYRAICNGIEGTIRIYRDRQGVSVHLDFNQKDKLTPNVVLQINSFSKV